MGILTGHLFVIVSSLGQWQAISKALFAQSLSKPYPFLPTELAVIGMAIPSAKLLSCYLQVDGA